MRKNFVFPKLLCIDTAMIITVPFLAMLILFEDADEKQYSVQIMKSLPVVLLIRLISFYIFGLYNRLWRYASINELIAIAGAVVFGSLFVTLYLHLTGTAFSRSFYFLCSFLLIALVGCSRMFLRVVYYLKQRSSLDSPRVLIVGAGDAGAMIAREIKQHYFMRKTIVGFVDDDPEKKDKYLFGLKIFGGVKDIPNLVEKFCIKEIILAIPSLNGNEMREIIQQCKNTGCALKTLPGIYELIDGKVTVKQLRDIQVNDLLRRSPVKMDMEIIAGYLTGKRVLVTGAGGSIGSELCRQIAQHNPEQLILLGRGENSIYEINRELQEKRFSFAIEPVIADIRDSAHIQKIFENFKPQVIFHAAAHKHVPLMEKQPMEAVKNNIFGTRNVAEAADRVNAEVFIMISTDKAVNPTSVMGVSKRVAEMLVRNLNNVSRTRFAAVRFGNVLGSRGSVVPLFQRQIANGGPVTVTHPEMTRYFMTIPEAVQLVLQAGSMTKGGEVFVLDMGEPVKILDMAKELIKLSGFMPNRDIAIEFIGMRSGEKLYEELLTAEEGTIATRHEQIYSSKLNKTDEANIVSALIKLEAAKTDLDIVQIFHEIVPSYLPAEIDSKPSLVRKPEMTPAGVVQLGMTPG